MLVRSIQLLCTCAWLFSCLSGCGTIPASEFDVPLEVAEELPPSAALEFLMSIPPEPTARECRFQPNGVQIVRWGKPLETLPYQSLAVRPLALGALEVWNPGQRLETWCWFGFATQKQRLRMDHKRFTRKALTALIALGMQVPSLGDGPSASP